MRGEPEGMVSIPREMSLSAGWGSLEDDLATRYRTAADPGRGPRLHGRRRAGRFPLREACRCVRFRAAGPGAFALRSAVEAGQGAGAALSDQGDGLQPGVAAASAVKEALIALFAEIQRREATLEGGYEGWEPVLDRIARGMLELVRDVGERPAAVGVGRPGLVDLEKGETRFLPNLPTQWRDVPWRGFSANGWGRPCIS